MKNVNFFLIMNHVVIRRYKKKNGTNLGRKLETLKYSHGNMYHNKCNERLMFHVIENVI
jgi:hypothetical protein